ncbi:MAG TPA: PKD domain-containing protein [Thermoanaerobaculia bacterium]|nr:PKD domain-containing protein [Thermoanaerobaculia bacterium]
MSRQRLSLPRLASGYLFLPALAAVLATLLLAAAPAAAQQVCGNTCQGHCNYLPCGTPAWPAPQSTWGGGELVPADPACTPLPAARDSTAFYEFTTPYASANFWTAIDIQNGYAFMGMGYGLQIWDTRSTPANPTMVGKLGPADFPFFPINGEIYYPIGTVSAPPGVDTMAGLGALYGNIGLAIVDTSTKSKPRVAYQGQVDGALQVYATTIAGTHYLFAATSYPTAVYLFNMDKAVLSSSACIENLASPGKCPGVDLGSVISGSAVYLAGVDNLLAVTGSNGLAVYNVSNPLSPQLEASGLNGSAFPVAMWKSAAGSYYVATRVANAGQTSDTLFIYDVTCASRGACTGLGTLVSQVTYQEIAPEAMYLTYSTSNGTPFLYLGRGGVCNEATQEEWLLDVSNPSAPRDISPPNGYWSWYYSGNPTGFNRFAPLMGKFNGSYFYRAGFILFDIHQWIATTAPTANFTWSPASPAPVYPGTPVSFDASSSTGGQLSYSWTFADGSPATSSLPNPTVTFPAQATYPFDETVSLKVTNTVGSNTKTQSVTLTNPAAQIASISVSPANPLQCQAVTLTANATGQAPLAYSSNIVNSSNQAVIGGPWTTNPFSWNSAMAAADTYTATVTVSNGTPPPAMLSRSFTLAALPTLAASGTFAPTNTPFTSGTVQFNVVAAGATEWNWNFGDNAGGGPNGDGYVGWSTDPIAGPSPIHTYTSVGMYTVTVQVRNCVNMGPATSTPLSVNVIQVTPLVALFVPGCSGFPCTGTVNIPVTFADLSTGSPTTWDYDWNGTGTFSDAGHTSPVTQHTYTTSTSYKPALRVNRGGQSATYAFGQGIFIEPASPPSISVSGSSSGATGTAYTFSAFASNCTPAASGWTWNVGGGGSGSSTSSSIAVTWANAGSWQVSASNSACSGASGSAGITISGTTGGGTLQAAFSFSPTSPLAGGSVAFDGSASTGATTYTWFFGDPNDATGASTVQASHVYSQAGTYTVKLDVSAPGSNCQRGVCISEATQTVTVQPVTIPALSGAFVSPACNSGTNSCTAVAGAPVTLTAADARGTTYAWDFGDGTTGSGINVTHSWSTAQVYTLGLAVSGAGYTSGTSSQAMVITPPPPPANQSVVLPWVAATRGALVQSCDLYLHNPGANPLPVTLEFRKRGTVDVNPPQATAVIPPGATMYAPDVLQSVFSRDNIAGFVKVTVKSTDPLPVMTSFNTVTRTDGSQFGQTVPGLAVPIAATSKSSTPASTFQYLAGLNDNSDELAYFGITNPTPTTTTYHVRLFDMQGNKIGESNGDLTVGPFGQRQFQQADVHNLFGLTTGTDYMVSIENKSGTTTFPYGENVRMGSGDPSFVTPGTTSAAVQYVVGAFSTNGSWQTDVVLANTGTQAMSLSLTFTRTGVTAPTTAPVALTLNPGDTQRLSNAIAGKWNLSNVVGVITVTSTGANGVYPIVQAESYNNAQPANRYGQSMAAFSDANQAIAGQAHYLVGLRQDANHLATIWVFNNSTTATGIYDIVYRGLDGTVLGTVSNLTLPPGKVKGLLPSQHPLPSGGVTGGFTVQVVVKNGTVLSAAQVLTTSTGDPAYVQGAAR